MKYFYLSAFAVLLAQLGWSQDVIYLADGSKLPAKISELSADKVKFKNPANLSGPLYTRSVANVHLIFNAAGNYLVYLPDTPPSDKDKAEFAAETTKARSNDILIDNGGNILAAGIIDESGEVTARSNGKEIKVDKKSLVAIIRKNGTHELFVPADQAMPFLALVKTRIKPLLEQQSNVAAVRENTQQSSMVSNATTTNKPVASHTVPASSEVNHSAGSEETVDAPLDMKLFSRKAVAKTKEFTGYLQNISSVNENRDVASKSVNLACGLFVDEEATVEVSNTKTKLKNKYRIRTYLNRLLLRSGQYDKIQIEYANINYASKFKKGADGNYYGVVTFVQKFQGFIDGNMVYGDVTKRNVTIVLKQYEKNVGGEALAGWDVFLADVGVMETRKI